MAVIHLLQDRGHALEGQPPRALPEFGRGQGQGEWGPRGMGAGHPWSYLGLATHLTSYRKPYGCGTLHTQSPAEWPLTTKRAGSSKPPLRYVCWASEKTRFQKKTFFFQISYFLF